MRQPIRQLYYLLRIGKLLGLHRHVQHRRIGLFWAVALVALTLPWLWQAGAGQGSGPADFAAGTVLEDCKVLSVYDGDTMTVLCDQHTDSPRKIKVRLYCIDAPEMGQKPWGRQARDHLRRLAGDHVNVRPITRDTYGRTVAEVERDGLNLNLEMVRAGEVPVYKRYCQKPAYAEAEWIIKSARVGIWKIPGLHQRPWEWRHHQ